MLILRFTNHKFLWLNPLRNHLVPLNRGALLHKRAQLSEMPPLNDKLEPKLILHSPFLFNPRPSKYLFSTLLQLPSPSAPLPNHLPNHPRGLLLLVPSLLLNPFNHDVQSLPNPEHLLLRILPDPHLPSLPQSLQLPLVALPRNKRGLSRQII